MVKRKEEHILECWTRRISGEVIYERQKQTKAESEKWFRELKEWIENGNR